MSERNTGAAAPISRRRFLKTSGGFTAGLLILPSARTAFSYQANERLNLAIIGVSGYASAAAFVPAIHIYDNVGITALCDVDRRKVEPARKLWRERADTWPSSTKPEERKASEIYRRLADSPPPLHRDYRRMFDQVGDDIDAVVVATPDHSHAAASSAAIRAGKHVLCEKPLTVTVEESRALRNLAVESRVATSMGNQGTQSPQFRRGLELIRDGTIGSVEQVHIWFNRGGANLQQAPQGAPPVPEELDWNLWLGPVAWREYHPDWIARTNWRATSAGQLGNFGPHTANLAFMALNIAELWDGAAPSTIRVESECSGVNLLSFPTWEKIRWHVPARGNLPPLTVHWHQGKNHAPGSRELIEKLMRDHGATDEDVAKLLLDTGAIIIGSKGVLVTDSHNVKITLLPADRFQDVEIDKPKIVPASRGHYRDWLHACRGGEPPLARFEYAATFNEFLMLGDVSTRFPGESLEYNTTQGRITNHPAAHDALGFGFREGWKL